jgi:hypothetical protein
LETSEASDEREPSQTAAAAATVHPPAKTESRAKSLCSSGVRSS